MGESAPNLNLPLAFPAYFRPMGDVRNISGSRPKRIAETRFDGSRMELGPAGRAAKSPPFWYSLALLAVTAFIVTWYAVPIAQNAMMSPEQRAAVETSVYYAGCDEVRALGRAPIHRGQPGYREGMDGDGDGVACEPYY